MPNLVLVPGPVLFLAQLAVGWRQRVVDPVLHWRQGFQIREHGFQIVVGEGFELAVRHDLVQFASAYVSGAHRCDECRFAVIANAGSVGREVDAGDIAPRPAQGFSAPIGERLLRIVASAAERHEILAARQRVGVIRLGNWFGDGLGNAAHQVVDGEIDLGRRE